MSRLMLGLLLALAAGGTLAADPAEQKVQDAIKTLVPDARIDSITRSELPGFYEVVLGGQPLYVSADGRYLISGALWDIGAKRNLTEARLAGLRKSTLDAVGADQRIIYPASQPKHVITVFTDIDCGYCRKMHSHIAEYNERGIQVDYLFFPRSGPGTPSFNKAVSVWCAADQKKAFTAAKSGVDPQPLQCDNPIAEEFQLGMQVGVDGTPAVFAPDGSKIGGYLTPDQLQAQLERIAAMNKSGS